MILISRDGTRLYVGIKSAALGLGDQAEQEKTPILWFDLDVGGSPLAADALVDLIRAKIDKCISEIRRQSYEQGARDRARKCKTFSGMMRTDIHLGGCYK